MFFSVRAVEKLPDQHRFQVTTISTLSESLFGLCVTPKSGIDDDGFDSLELYFVPFLGSLRLLPSSAQSNSDLDSLQIFLFHC